MATIDELLREEAEVREAELDALDKMNGHMAEIAGGLPKGSLLARRLALVVREFDRLVDRRSISRPGDVASYQMRELLREIEQDHEDAEGED